MRKDKAITIRALNNEQLALEVNLIIEKYEGRFVSLVPLSTVGDYLLIIRINQDKGEGEN